MKATTRKHGPALLVAALVLMALCLSPASASAQGGWMDTSFGERGRVTTGFGKDAVPTDYSVTDLAIDSRGRIVIGARGGRDDTYWANPSYFVVRLRPDGSLDRSLTGDGVLRADFGSNVAVGPQDRIFIAGAVGRESSGREIEVRRYLPDGRLDRSFAGDGSTFSRSALSHQVTDLVVSKNGSFRVFSFGRCSGPRPGCGYSYSASVVTPFTSSGKLLISRRAPSRMDSDDRETLRDPRGRLLIGRGSLEAIEVNRRLAGGSSDPGFGTAGGVTIPLATTVARDEGIGALTVDRTGRPVAGGATCVDYECSSPTVSLARYLPGGRLDRTFGNEGRVLTPGRGLIRTKAIADLADGSVVVGGDTRSAAFLARYLPNGRLDASFGETGVVTFNPSDPGRSTQLLGLAVQRDGKTVAVGYGYSDSYPGEVFGFVARFLTEGSLDPGFGSGGVTYLPFERKFALMHAVAVGKGGQIIATGGDSGTFSTVRLKRDGSLDESFGHDGFALTRNEGPSGARALVLGPQGQVTVAGGPEFNQFFSDAANNFIVRYLPNGRLDRSFGSQGRVIIRRVAVADLALTKCGLFAAGTANRQGRRSMAVASISRGARSGLVADVRYPFGRTADSYLDAMAPVDGRRNLVLAGRYERVPDRGDFALAKVRTEALAPSCGG